MRNGTTAHLWKSINTGNSASCGVKEAWADLLSPNIKSVIWTCDHHVTQHIWSFRYEISLLAV